MQLIDSDLVFGESIFTTSELDTVRQICDSQIAITGAYDKTDTDVSTLSYDSYCCYISKSLERKFLFNRIAEYGKHINETYFNLDLLALMPKGLLFTRYDTPGNHIGWHTDKKEHSKSVDSGIPDTIRKMTLTIQLSDPSEYEGCDIQIMTDQGLKEVPKQKGAFYCIPGYAQHQVTPLIRGERTALVAWFIGPKFK